MIAIGVGCRKACSAEEIVSLVRNALDSLHRPQGERRRQASLEPRGLFTIAEKRDEAGLGEAATILGLPLVFLEAEALRRVAGGAATVSPRVEAMHGLPSIAETAALAGAGKGAALLVARMSTPSATCAIAGPRP